MIGRRPNFIDSPYFYEDNDGWHMKDGAPDDVKKEFDEFMEAAEQVEHPPDVDKDFKPPQLEVNFNKFK